MRIRLQASTLWRRVYLLVFGTIWLRFVPPLVHEEGWFRNLFVIGGWAVIASGILQFIFPNGFVIGDPLPPEPPKPVLAPPVSVATTKGCLVVFALPLILFGLLFSSAGFSMLSSRLHLAKSGVKTTGTIVDVATYPGKGRGFAPVVRFTDASGTVRTMTPTEYSGTRPQIGATADIIYDPADPTKGELASGTWSYVGAIVFLAAGLIPLLIGLVLLFLGTAAKKVTVMPPPTDAPPTDAPPTA